MNTLSLIVPVYNVELYILDCLRSVNKQICDQLEIIIVNDGSTDGSMKLVNDFFLSLSVYDREKYKIISQKNQGLSSARNTGISHANGDYLCFLDSDDILLGNFSIRILEIINKYNVDIVKFKYKRFKSEDDFIFTESYINLEGVYNVDNNMIVELFNDASWYAWLHAYKRCLFDNIKFPVGLNFEDVSTIPYLYRNCNKIYFLNAYIYGYRLRQNSITTSKNSSVLERNILSIKYILEMFYKEIDNDKRFYILYIFFVRIYMSFLIKNKGIFFAYKEWCRLKSKKINIGDEGKHLIKSRKNLVYYVLFSKAGFLSNFLIVYIAKIYSFYKRFFV